MEPTPKKVKVVVRTKSQKPIRIFNHLAQYERESSLTLKVGFSEDDFKRVHPAILRLGLKYGENKISGSTTRAVEMLNAFKIYISDYKTPKGKAFARDLDKQLKPLIQFLIDCRPHSITMGNAIKYLRHCISIIPPETSDDDAKKLLINAINRFINMNVSVAQNIIGENGADMIQDDDIILTYHMSNSSKQV